MPNPKLIVNQVGLDAQFRLVPEDDEEEEGQIDDDDEDESEDEGLCDEDDEKQANESLDSSQRDSKDGSTREKHTHGPDTSALSLANDKTPESESSNKQKKPKKQPRITLFEMQSFMIALILPEPRLSTPPNWCRVIRCMRASNVGIFLLDNVDLDWIPDKGSKFTHAFRFEAPPDWIGQLTNVPLSSRMQSLAIRDHDSDSLKFDTNLNARERVSRVQLLLSPIQMLVEGYPMPFEEEIRVLRSKYSNVNDYSPIFAVDCEMCITDRSELTRISIVDEEMRVVYNELVKPSRPITNYLTRYSGITKNMMENVTTTIDDVQAFLRKNLPRDAILCGHSLNMDLSAMQIFHPYVIDTSIIYNRTGTRSYKPSLRSIAYELLGKSIQTADKVGHDSLEDAITAMELVKLKLVSGLTFGDTVAHQVSQGIKFDSKTGITHLQFDRFIERHKVSSISYRCIDTTPGARCLYIHDKCSPLEQEVKDAVLQLIEKPTAICVIMTNFGDCYVKI